MSLRARLTAISTGLLLICSANSIGLAENALRLAEGQRNSKSSDLFEQTRVLIQKATQFYNDQDVGNAIPLLQQAEKNLQNESAKKAGHLDNVLVELGQCYYSEKKYDAALDCFARAFEIRESSGFLLPIDRPELAELYLKHGLLAKAVHMFESSGDWSGLAKFSLKQGNLNQASAALIKHFTVLKGKPASLLTQTNIELRKELESIYKRTGRSKDAASLYTELVSAFENNSKGNLEDLQNSLGLLADFYYRNNALEKVEPVLLRQLQIPLASREKLVCLFNLAGIAEIRRKESQAEKYYKQALALKEKIEGLSREQKVNVIAQHSDFLWRQKKFQEAEKSVRSELECLGNSSRAGWFWAYANSRLGLLYLSAGKFNQGESYLQNLFNEAIEKYKANLSREKSDELQSGIALQMEQRAYESLRMFYLQNHKYDKLEALALKQLDFMTANGAYPFEKYAVMNLLFWAYCNDGKLDEARRLLQDNNEILEAEEPDRQIHLSALACKQGDGKAAEQQILQARKYFAEREKPEPSKDIWPPVPGISEITYTSQVAGSPPMPVQRVSNGTISSLPVQLLNTADFKLYLPEPNLFGGFYKRANGAERECALFSIKESDQPPGRRERLYSLPLEENIGSVGEELLPAYFDHLLANAYAIQGQNKEALLSYERATEFEKREVARFKNYIDGKRLLVWTLNDYSEFLQKQGKTQAAEMVKHQASKVEQEIRIMIFCQ